MAGSAHEIVLETERRWTDLLTGDCPASAATLYAVDAVFFGSKPRLYFGREEIAQYFADVSPGLVLEAAFTDRRVTRVNDDVIVSAAYVTFRYSSGSVREAVYRITLTLVKSVPGWLIAQHHASPRR
jgi:hypothetical protein